MTFESVLVFGFWGFLLGLMALQSFKWAAVPALTTALSMPLYSFLNRLPNYGYPKPVFLLILVVSAFLALGLPQWIKDMRWRAAFAALAGPVFIWHAMVTVVGLMMKVIP